MAEGNSKDLLQLEAKSTESKLLVCKKDKPFSPPEAPLEKPTMFPLPRSQVLGKVKDFLGVFSESNKKLMQEAKDNPDNYDIEVLSGKESEYIEMDLMLGVADLHTPEAVAAAESAMAGYQPAAIALSEDEDSSDEDEESKEDKINEQDNESGSQSLKSKSKNAEGDSPCKKSRKQKQKSKKRPKIVELS